MIERQILSDVAWGMIAFCLWVPLIPVAKRLRLPGAVGLAAAAGWLIARVIVTVVLTNRR
jgi:hypothetical protein